MKRLVPLYVAAFLLVSCGEAGQSDTVPVAPPEPPTHARVTLHDGKGNEFAIVTAEMADTNEEKRKGLMNRTVLGKNAGMIFMYDRDQKTYVLDEEYKNSLDIFFINLDGSVVDIQTMQPCKKDPCKKYPAKEPAAFALEVNAGFAEKHGVPTGAKSFH